MPEAQHVQNRYKNEQALCLALYREEKLYDREAVLGRDVTSVFPTQNEGAERVSTEKAKLSVGAARFVSETQVSAYAAAVHTSLPCKPSDQSK